MIAGARHDEMRVHQQAHCRPRLGQAGPFFMGSRVAPSPFAKGYISESEASALCNTGHRETTLVTRSRGRARPLSSRISVSAPNIQ